MIRYEELSTALSEIEVAPRPVLEELTLIIPTLSRDILQTCLCHIVCGNAWPGKLIVVDQGSSPLVAGWIERLQVIGIDAEHVPSTERGRAAGVNRGLERVETRFVCITDDDCLVDADWLSIMVERLQENPEAVVTGRVEPAGDGVLITLTSLVPVVHRRPSLTTNPLSGGNMGTSLSVLKRVGPFDEDACLRTAEDGEWGYRVLRAGVPVIYEPDAVVRHFGWRDDRERVVQYRGYALSQGGFYGKYLRRGDPFIALRALVHLLRALRWWLGGMITRDRHRSLNGWAYLTGLPAGILAGLRGQKSS